jgi:hypothetical protein
METALTTNFTIATFVRVPLAGPAKPQRDRSVQVWGKRANSQSARNPDPQSHGIDFAFIIRGFVCSQ